MALCVLILKDRLCDSILHWSAVVTHSNDYT